jgi:hypothetical protein
MIVLNPHACRYAIISRLIRHYDFTPELFSLCPTSTGLIAILTEMHHSLPLSVWISILHEYNTRIGLVPSSMPPSFISATHPAYISQLHTLVCSLPDTYLESAVHDLSYTLSLISFLSQVHVILPPATLVMEIKNPTEHPLAFTKTDTIKTLSRLLFGGIIDRRFIQDQIRTLGGIGVVLSQCCIDDYNPREFMRGLMK